MNPSAKPVVTIAHITAAIVTKIQATSRCHFGGSGDSVAGAA